MAIYAACGIDCSWGVLLSSELRRTAGHIIDIKEWLREFAAISFTQRNEDHFLKIITKRLVPKDHGCKNRAKRLVPKDHGYKNRAKRLAPTEQGYKIRAKWLVPEEHCLKIRARRLVLKDHGYKIELNDWCQKDYCYKNAAIAWQWVWWEGHIFIQVT